MSLARKRFSLMVLGSLVLGLPLGGSPAAGEATQTDWSAGAGAPGPVLDWGAGFDGCAGTAWLSIPGQLALAGTPLATAPEHLINDEYYRSFGICAVDIDQDGDTDVLGCAEYSGVVALWLNDGANPPAWTQQVVDGQFPGADAVEAADIDGDGLLDIVASAGEPGYALAWWRNGGGQPIAWERRTIDAYAPSFEVHVADLDLDGDPDIVSAIYLANEIAWWRNDGGHPVVWARQSIAVDIAGAHSVFASDLDGDGDVDVVGAAAIANQIAYWRNDGGAPTVWTKVVVREGYLGARSVYVADIDADGDPDIAGTAWSHHVTWWRNEGGAPLGWSEQHIDAAFNGGHSVWVADIDGNGHRDVLAAGCTANDIHWYANDGGTPITWTRNRVDVNYAAPIQIRSGDLDGDGDLDILATSYTLGEFTWWEATRFVTQGELVSSILDTRTSPALPAIDWGAVTPPGTTLRFQVRHGEAPEALGTWSAPMAAPGSLGSEFGRYVQYRALMDTADPRVSPILRHITLSWTASTSTGDHEQPGDLIWDLRAATPCGAEVVLELAAGRPGTAALVVLDASGRRVRGFAPRTYALGRHRIHVGALPAGVYHCLLSGDQLRVVQRLVVIR